MQDIKTFIDIHPMSYEGWKLFSSIILLIQSKQYLLRVIKPNNKSRL